MKAFLLASFRLMDIAQLLDLTAIVMVLTCYLFREIFLQNVKVLNFEKTYEGLNLRGLKWIKALKQFVWSVPLR